MMLEPSTGIVFFSSSVNIYHHYFFSVWFHFEDAATSTRSGRFDQSSQFPFIAYIHI